MGNTAATCCYCWQIFVVPITNKLRLSSLNNNFQPSFSFYKSFRQVVRQQYLDVVPAILSTAATYCYILSAVQAALFCLLLSVPKL